MVTVTVAGGSVTRRAALVAASWKAASPKPAKTGVNVAACVVASMATRPRVASGGVRIDTVIGEPAGSLNMGVAPPSVGMVKT